jgi:Ni,Fe-hydrogenase I cytochrome b subunit
MVRIVVCNFPLEEYKMLLNLLLVTFLVIGGFGFYSGVANLFIAAVVGLVAIVVNEAAQEESLFASISYWTVLGVWLYAVYLAVTVALKLYF